MKILKVCKRKFISLFYKIKKFFYLKFNFKIVKGYYKLKLYSNWEDSTFNSYYFGYYGDELKNEINNFNTPFIFIDVGANQGLYSLLALKNKNCLKVYAFEPVRKTFLFLKNNISINYSNKLIEKKCRLYNYGISNFAEKKDISIPIDSSGKASLNKFRSFKNYYRETIETVNLDWLNKSIRFKKNSYVFLKVDVEGLEEIVIREFLNTNFAKNIKYIVFEKNDEWDFIDYSKIEDFLSKKDFLIKRLQKNENKKYDLFCERI